MNYIKRNWLSILAVILSVISICLVCFRIEPIDFSNGTILSFVTSLIGICATIMVASQIMGLRMSEMKVKSMLTDESQKIREESHIATINGLFKVELLAANLSAESQSWDNFIAGIGRLTSYVLDAKDTYMANKVAKLLIDSEVSFHFTERLYDEKRQYLYKHIFSLIKLVDNPIDLITLFKVQQTIE